MRANRRAWSIAVVTVGVITAALVSPSVEPASDYTANSLLAFTLGAAGLG